MVLKFKNFRGGFNATYVEPTEKELLWLFNKLKDINNRLNDYYFSGFDGYCTHCDTNSYFQSYRIYTQNVTDVDKSDWDSDDRGLQITVCTNCKCWSAVDY